MRQSLNRTGSQLHKRGEPMPKAAAEPALKNPTVRNFAGCCPLATSGHTAAPPSSVKNARRFIIR
jgi:hypothetical protein